MKTRISGIRILGSIVAAAMIATIPLMAQASDSQATSASTKTAQSSEMAGLKRELFLCKQHKMRRRAARARVRAQVPAPACTVTQVIERHTIVEKPVILERIIEKQVFVDRPTVVEKQVFIERPVQMEKRVVVEHSKHRKHLLHFGIPFIGVNLF